MRIDKGTKKLNALTNKCLTFLHFLKSTFPFPQKYNRKCEQNQVFFKTGDPHPYCKNACEAHTMCGEVEVPEEHLEVCRVCNAFGQNCQSHESSKPAGPGKMHIL